MGSDRLTHPTTSRQKQTWARCEIRFMFSIQIVFINNCSWELAVFSRRIDLPKAWLLLCLWLTIAQACLRCPTKKLHSIMSCFGTFDFYNNIGRKSQTRILRFNLNSKEMLVQASTAAPSPDISTNDFHKPQVGWWPMVDVLHLSKGQYIVWI